MPSHTKFQQLALTGLMQKRSGCLPAALSRFGWGIQPGTKKTAGLGGKSLLSSKTTIYLQAETELKHPGTKWWRLPDAWDCGYAIPNQYHPGFLSPPAPEKTSCSQGGNPGCPLAPCLLGAFHLAHHQLGTTTGSR